MCKGLTDDDSYDPPLPSADVIAPNRIQMNRVGCFASQFRQPDAEWVVLLFPAAWRQMIDSLRLRSLIMRGGCGSGLNHREDIGQSVYLSSALKASIMFEKVKSMWTKTFLAAVNHPSGTQECGEETVSVGKNDLSPKECSPAVDSGIDALSALTSFVSTHFAEEDPIPMADDASSTVTDWCPATPLSLSDLDVDCDESSALSRPLATANGTPADAENRPDVEAEKTDRPAKKGKGIKLGKEKADEIFQRYWLVMTEEERKLERKEIKNITKSRISLKVALEYGIGRRTVERIIAVGPQTPKKSGRRLGWRRDIPIVREMSGTPKRTSARVGRRPKVTKQEKQVVTRMVSLKSSAKTVMAAVEVSKSTIHRIRKTGVTTPRRSGPRSQPLRLADAWDRHLVERELNRFYEKNQVPALPELLHHLRGMGFPYKTTISLSRLLKNMGYAKRKINR